MGLGCIHHPVLYDIENSKTTGKMGSFVSASTDELNLTDKTSPDFELWTHIFFPSPA